MFLKVIVSQVVILGSYCVLNKHGHMFSRMPEEKIRVRSAFFFVVVIVYLCMYH